MPGRLDAEVTSCTGSPSATKPYMPLVRGGKAFGQRIERRLVTGPSGSGTGKLVVLAGVAHVDRAGDPARLGAIPASANHAPPERAIRGMHR